MVLIQKSIVVDDKEVLYMAKDDMLVLFCKTLIYLYKVLKGKQERDEYYIQPMTNDFPISETYLQTVLIELQV